MYTFLRSARVSPRHCTHRVTGDTNAHIHNLILRFRRIRRLCRPYIPVIVRLCIVLFTVIELHPTENTTSNIFSVLSRLGIITAILSAFFSVIFFDTRVFNLVIVATIFVKFFFDLNMSKPFLLHQLVASVCFHTTSILFSTAVGRRRSITKPIALRCSKIDGGLKEYYMEVLATLRQVDVLEAGTRLQASLLAIDYSLSRDAGVTSFMFTLPFAILFLVGYGTQRNGFVLLILLSWLSISNDKSPVFGFNFLKTFGTVSGALLGLLVGPGSLAIDEWLATNNQLCY